MDIDYQRLLKLLSDYKYNETDKPYIICFIGGPGYGKSYLAKLISKRFNIPIVSNDKIRRLLESEGLDYKNRDIVHKIEYAQIYNIIKNKSSVILDANSIRTHDVISKKADDYNIKCYFINLTCDEDTIIERLKYRETQFGKDDNYSRATYKYYYEYKECLKSIKFPKEKIFFEIKTDEDLDKQIDELFNRINEDLTI